MSNFINFKLNFDEDVNAYIKSKYPNILEYRVISKSLDARGAGRGKKPIFNYRVEYIEQGDRFSSYEENIEKIETDIVPIIIGAGPAGLFAALRFSEYGMKSIVIERGDPATTRMLAISKYWRKGILNKESNVCYGEGGAGLFSDGKLITRIKSHFVKYVMKKFVDFGAPEETAYVSNPHLGSNKIRKIITKISTYLIGLGHEFIYNDGVDEILFEEDKVIGVKLKSGKKLMSSKIILATGHSAKDMYYHLHENKVAMKAKSFAVGVRIEHPRKYIDSVQHGRYNESEFLGSARYKLSYHNKNTDKGTYSFCMCPGGYVLSSGTDEDGLVSNGMSNYSRNSPWSNAALVVSVKAGIDFDENDVLAGIRFQENIEKKAYAISKQKASGKELPAMTVGEFLKGKLSEEDLPKTSCPSKLIKTDIREIFPKFINDHLKTALYDFDKKLEDFASEDALLIAPETRTSAPITILRDKERLESISHKGLYPGGEGAGFAGGITSAAVDGIKIAESIVKSL
ncbi:MAG: NAD(P)/FAD-dependent oxidoreductase [Bacteriovoracaceae bacterium]|jgi:uncharacterized FAD-dependent dehydrogenase|nr:NAD(P)/FAD-dependent oxidoreductase [Bacteriovoracaceae bacterium]